MFRLDELGQEILSIAVPAALALAADPLASLVDTAFIGRLGLIILYFLINNASHFTVQPFISESVIYEVIDCLL